VRPGHGAQVDAETVALSVPTKPEEVDGRALEEAGEGEGGAQEEVEDLRAPEDAADGSAREDAEVEEDDGRLDEGEVDNVEEL
jgi:hypothetical protein